MRTFAKAACKKVNGVYFFVEHKLRKFMTEKKEGGAETFVVILIIIAICCGIAAIFKDQLVSFMKTLFDELKGDILTDFTAKPTV